MANNINGNNGGNRQDTARPDVSQPGYQQGDRKNADQGRDSDRKVSAPDKSSDMPKKNKDSSSCGCTK